MPSAHIYVRVSTDQQDLSPDWQRDICLNYYRNSLANRGFELGGVFEDIGQSAFKIPWNERENGKELFRACQPGDCIVVAKQDRAFRTVRDRENTAYYCQQMSIGLVILDMQLDTTTAAGEFAAGIMALQAQWESRTKSERQKAAHSVRKKRKTPGKAHPPPGWKYDAHKEELVPDYAERSLLHEIYRYQLKGTRSLSASCRYLDDHSIYRANGCKYDKVWVKRAYYSYKNGWPPEGYVRAFWKTATPEEKAKYSLRQIRVAVRKPGQTTVKREATLRQCAEACRAANAKPSAPAGYLSSQPEQAPGN